MANDRDRNSQNDSEDAEESKRDRTIGRGMDSLDSTQAPLKAETGEPDYEAMSGKAREEEEDSE